LQRMGERELMLAVRHTQVFADVDPGQKERLLRALQRAGHVVGYLGDGINDALALHTADVGISVDTAVDVAKDAADLVLLRKDLGVLLQGITEESQYLCQYPQVFVDGDQRQLRQYGEHGLGIGVFAISSPAGHTDFAQQPVG